MKYLAIIFCLVSCLPIKQNKPLSLIKDNWINKEYLIALKESHSLKTAGIEPIAYVQITNNYIGRIYNFHESAGRITDSLICTATPNLFTLNHYSSDSIQIVDNNHIIWNYNDGDGNNDKLELTRLKEPISIFINKIIICGKYTDIKGNSYIFRDTGCVLWNDSTYNYSIGLVLVGSDKEYITFSQANESKDWRYGFSINDDKLMFYKEILRKPSDEGVYFESTPFLTLTK